MTLDLIELQRALSTSLSSRSRQRTTLTTNLETLAESASLLKCLLARWFLDFMRISFPSTHESMLDEFASTKQDSFECATDCSANSSKNRTTRIDSFLHMVPPKSVKEHEVSVKEISQLKMKPTILFPGIAPQILDGVFSRESVFSNCGCPASETIIDVKDSFVLHAFRDSGESCNTTDSGELDFRVQFSKKC